MKNTLVFVVAILSIHFCAGHSDIRENSEQFYVTEEGKQLDLSCHLVGKKSWSACVWKHNSQNAARLTLNNGNENEENSMTLYPEFESRLRVNATKENCSVQILNATQELDSGTWTCSLTQSASDLNHEAQVQVQVFTRPIIKMTLLQNLKKPESSAKTLENGGDSQKEYWKVTDKLILGFDYLISVSAEIPEVGQNSIYEMRTEDISAFFKIVSFDPEVKNVTLKLNQTRGMVIDLDKNSFHKHFTFKPTFDVIWSFSQLTKGFAALECSVVQWLEMDENPKFHRKLIETDSMLLIDKMLIATRNLDEPNQFDQDDLDQNVMETKPPVEGFRLASMHSEQHLPSSEVKKDPLLLYIMIPFVICVFILLTIFLMCCAYRNGWWCFSSESTSGYSSVSTKSSVENDYNKNILSQFDSGIRSEDKGEMPSNPAALNNHHIYEEIILPCELSGSSDRLYDTLDFQRPNAAHLCPHYQTTNSVLSEDRTSSANQSPGCISPTNQSPSLFSLTSENLPSPSRFNFLGNDSTLKRSIHKNESYV